MAPTWGRLPGKLLFRERIFLSRSHTIRLNSSIVPSHPTFFVFEKLPITSVVGPDHTQTLFVGLSFRDHLLDRSQCLRGSSITSENYQRAILFEEPFSRIPMYIDKPYRKERGP